jgi:TP901 family phage tail tape measure protein
MTGTADRSVAVEVLARVSGYTRDMGLAAGATERLSVAMQQAAKSQRVLEGSQARSASAATKAAQAAKAAEAAQRKQLTAMTSLGRGLVVFGGLAAVGFGAAAKASADFGKEMANVRALLGHNATQQDLRALTNAALEVGQQFGYTATQVATAEAELVKAGVSVANIMSGGLTASLTLAAAGQTNLAEATEIAAFAMTAFGKAGKDLPHIADLLSAGADKALGGVSDLGLALKQVATPAAQAGISIEDTVGALAALAQNTQIGERGGTALKQALLQLQAPSAKAAELMDRYGINLFQANGQSKNFAQIAGNLRSSLQGLTEEQRQHALAVIFGSHAIQAANILYKEGQAGIQGWESRVNDAGFAAQQARDKLDSLSGDVQKLGAAFQTGLIKTGDQASSSLRGLVQGLTAVVNAFDSLGPGARTLVVDVTALAAVTGLAGGAALIAIPKYVQFRNALAELGITAKATSVALGEEAAAATAAGRANGAAAASTGSKLGKLGKAAGPIGLVVSGLAIGKSAIDASVAGRVQDKTDELAGDPKKLAAAKQRLADIAKQLDEIKKAQAGLPGAAGSRPSGNAASLAGEYETLTKEVKDASVAATANALANADADAGLKAMGSSAAFAAIDIDKLGSVLDGVSHKFDLQGAQDQLTTGWKNLAKQVKETSGAVRGNSADALANRAALREQYNGAVAVINAYASQKDSAGNLIHTNAEVAQKAKEVAAGFQHSADKALGAKGKADNYAAALRKIPKSVNTTISIDDAVARAKLRALKAGFSALEFHAAQRDSGATPGATGYRGGTVRDGKISRLSRGGSVFGGPPGRDTVPAFLDNGEEVISKRPAAKWRPVLKLINADKMAAGGTAGQPNLSDIFSLIQTSRTGKKALPSFASQFVQATIKTQRTDAQFLANLQALAARGFGFLATQLLEQGDHTAKVIAAQALHMSNRQLSGTSARLQASAKTQKQLGLLPAQLAIASALRTGKNPSLGSIAAATGIDIADLQAGLQAMAGGLKGNRNAGQLLRGLNTVGAYQQSGWGAGGGTQGPMFIVQVEDSSGQPVKAGEKAGAGAQRVLSLSGSRW